jgi:hypothetical protein
VLKEDREVFLVAPEIQAELSNELVPHQLVVAITRQNVLFVWPLRLPTPDGRVNSWHESAIQAAHLATSTWVRVAANMGLGAYEVSTAIATLPDPEWPDLTLQQILRRAFNGRYIDALDHPALKRLRGEL